MSSPARLRWSRLVQQLETSDLTIREFARQHDVNASTLGWWRSRLRRDQRLGHLTSASFAELVVADPDAPTDPYVVVDLPKVAAHVRVDDSTDLRLLRAVLEALC